ncbi:MAG: nucleoside deaminase [Deltaproteobacteria bacterium]|nr:nucleoside deaminase [Deltaproteobacteria bacterium]
MAIAEAVRGARAGLGGPFGAVVVRDGVVVGKASNAVIANRDPTAHAEVLAIRAACAALGSHQLAGCDVYASCEPCPMCLGAVLWARPRALYFAATRADAAAAGFDDAAFHDTVSGRSVATAFVRERVPCEDAGVPFAVYAGLAGRVRY